MTRREIREHLIKLLYCQEFHEKEDMHEQMKFYFDKLNISENDCEYIKGKFKAINENMDSIDNIISENCVGWKINRIAKVDLCILRLSVYEIKFVESIPDKVAINEAIEIAKIYGQENSSGFINGVLAKIL